MEGPRALLSWSSFQGQVAETVNASLPSLYCREDEISSDPSAPCYWETFVKGSQSQGTSFSKDVPEAFTFVEVEMNRIWTKTMTSGDPLLPDSNEDSPLVFDFVQETFYKIFCYAEDDWPTQAASASTSVEAQVELAWCQAVRSGFAVPAVIDILASGFSSVQLEEPYNGTVTITSERNEVGPVPLQLGTDYEVGLHAWHRAL
eukprot:Skav205260  [mRNA]  locus=scaffold1841:98281:100035:- [translate_table: standard]